MTLEIIVPSTGNHGDAIKTWEEHAGTTFEYPTVLDCIEGPGAGFLAKLQKGYEESTADLLAYFHSDLFIHEEGWDERVLAEFEDESVGIVGFGGGKRLGSPDIYKIPYRLQQLARFDFVSNLRDAETHGRRNRNEEDIAVVDSFALIIRRSLLAKVGGWPVATYPPMHCSDLWACLMARRHGYRVRMVGISCTHKSGGVKGDGTFDYAEWCKTAKCPGSSESGVLLVGSDSVSSIWGSDQAMHTESHRLIYKDFRDVLPVVVS